MLIRCLNLPPPNRFDGRILWRTNGAFKGGLLVHVDAAVLRRCRYPVNVHVQTSLVKGVLAEEMHRGEVERATTGLTATGLEDHGSCGEFIEFFLFGFSFGFVAGD